MRRLLLTTAAASLLAAGVVAAAPAGYADPTPATPGAGAYSSAASTGSATLAATLNLTGAIGGLLNGLISPIVNTALNPLVAALQGTVNGVVASALGASSTFTAGSPTQQSSPAPGTFPGDLPGGLPSPCGSSATTPCFQNATLGVNAAPLASVGVSSLAGYTQQVQSSADATNPIFGRAQVVSPSVTALAGITSLLNPLVTAGVVSAKANCPNVAGTAPTALVSATNVSALGGLIKLNVLNGSITNLVVNGTSYPALSTLPVLSVAGVLVRSYGTAVRVDVPLTLDQLVAGLGLPAAAITELLNDATSATLKLSVIIGPTTSVTATSATAAGLNVGVDLSGAAQFNLLGLVGATVAIPSGIGGGNYGNLVDARLGYATCQSGTSGGQSAPSKAIPPGLV